MVLNESFFFAVDMVKLLLSNDADTNVCNFLGLNCRDIVFELEKVVDEDICDLVKSKSDVKRYIKATNLQTYKSAKKRRT